MNGVQLTIVGMVVGKTGVTLYLDNGGDLQLANDAWRTSAIVKEVAVTLAVEGTATLNLSEYSIAQKVAEATNGEIKIVGEDPGLNQNAEFQVVTADVKIANGSALQTQIERAVFGDGFKGFKAFMQHYGAIKRNHSAEDLLTFMEKGKMHIADDGRIVAFKRLNQDIDEWCKDVHTGSVKQRLGSRVQMNEVDVDPNRSQECSNGLHVATQLYLAGFEGNRLALVKIDPQAVVAVPKYDTSKMRVASYDIVGFFDEADASKVVKGATIADIPGAAQLLSNVIAGNHAPITEIVHVGRKGGGRIEKLGEQIVAEQNAPRPIAKDGGVDKRGEVVNPKLVNELIASATAGDMGAAITAASKPKKAKKVEAPKPAVPQVAANADYTSKLQNAVEMFKAGSSIREIAKMLRMDRESLSKKLRQMGLSK